MWGNAGVGMPQAGMMAGGMIPQMQMPMGMQQLQMQPQQQQQQQQTGGNNPKHDIFVGNLAFNTTEEQLHQAFSEIGRVLNVRLVTDMETGKPRGFAFVEFEDPQAALSAIRNMNEYELNGRRLRVNFSNSSHLEALAGKLGMDLSQQTQSRSNIGTASSAAQTPALASAAATSTGTSAVADALKNFSKGEMYDVIAKLKEIADRDPDEARRLLSGHPQLPEALLFLMSKLDMVKTPIATAEAALPGMPGMGGMVGMGMPPQQQQQQQQTLLQQQQQQQMYQQTAAAAAAARAADPRRVADPRAMGGNPAVSQQPASSAAAAAAAGSMMTSPPPPPPPLPVGASRIAVADPRQRMDPRARAAQQQQQQQQGIPPPPPPPILQQQQQYGAAHLDPGLVQQVMSLTPQQIQQLPPDKQQSILQLRQQITGGSGM